jgi:protein SHQ1
LRWSFWKILVKRRGNFSAGILFTTSAASKNLPMIREVMSDERQRLCPKFQAHPASSKPAAVAVLLSSMIVPRFSISQTETLLVVKIHVPYIRVSEAEIFSENNEFTFYCKPYYLKVAFEGQISGDDNCKAQYDPNDENGVIIAELPKLFPGTYFPDLDLPSKLLLNRKLADSSKYKFPSIDVISESNNASIQSGEVGEDALVLSPPSPLAPLLKPHYGFNHKYCDVLKHQREEILTIFSIANPDDIPAHQRRDIRLNQEIASFDVDRYLGDFLEGVTDPIYIETMSYHPFWEEMWKNRKELSKEEASGGPPESSREDEIFNKIGFSEEETETMRRLPHR